MRKPNFEIYIPRGARKNLLIELELGEKQLLKTAAVYKKFNSNSIHIKELRGAAKMMRQWARCIRKGIPETQPTERN